jgi:hypothetical protein
MADKYERDDDGRIVGERLPERPAGPWDNNGIRTVCAWCPGFVPTAAPAGVPVSHGICPVCAERMRKEMEQ